MKPIWVGFGMLCALALGLSGCTRAPAPVAPPIDRDAISARLMANITVLASEEFGGRLPGTEGEILTIDYLIEEMRSAGLESGTNDPGNPWRAPVQLIDTEPRSSRLIIRQGDREFELDAERSLAITTRRRALVEAGEMVFVGRLAEDISPETIRGKVVVMLGEPGLSPDRRDILFERDPAAIITVVDADEAINAIRDLNMRPRQLLALNDTANLSAFVSRSAFSEAVGRERWSELLARADQADFAPVALASTATIEATSQRRDFTSYNVIGKLAGRNPAAGSILLLAHWDHLGECGAPDSADRLCNGAVDNASGLAVMLELARRISADAPLGRDIYLMATTAEESGLLGIRAFVETPALPLESIVAAFNFDTAAVAPSGSPVGFIGEGRTALDPIVSEVMSELDRSLGSRLVADQFLRRQDSWALLQEGVPAVMISTSFGSQITLNTYLAERYHRPSDEIAGIELGGAIDDLLLHEELIRRIADTEAFPASGG